ncbi:MAG: DMT family transporter [Chitinophagaceae bacterium]|nr:DMT family transporter [Chitinophagaceae bacterium]
MNNKFYNWLLFVLLCLIWGSSFILMKWGLYDKAGQPVLSAYQVAALRMLTAGMIMLPFVFQTLKKVPRRLFGYILLSGWLGSFFPAFLFCIAETKIGGALAGSLNSLTPLFVVITGAVFFGILTSLQKILGVIAGLAGTSLLIYANVDRTPEYIAYTGFVVAATILYGINVNMVHSKLKGVSSVQIAAIAFTGLIPASLLVLFFTGYFDLPLAESAYTLSTLASSMLGIVGTALASIIFYVMVKRAGGLFASLVTYGIPFVAIGWGIYYGEKIMPLQVVALLVILLGVYLANRSVKQLPKDETVEPPVVD